MNRVQAVVLAAAVIAGNVVAYGQTKAQPAVKPAPPKPATQALPQLVVFKTPTCGCCANWVQHMEKNGFTAKVTNMPDLSAVKEQNGVTQRLSSCHTTLVGGYVIEGHVPAEDVRRLLKEKPAGIAGLAAPGMPAGSPGMDVPNSPAYQIIAFDKAGKTSVYATHPAK
jgi:hypothetical protein